MMMQENVHNPVRIFLHFQSIAIGAACVGGQLSGDVHGRLA
jgi:hypothetical protein